MESVVLYQTTNPKVQTELADLIFKFEGMQILGCTMKDFEKHFFKEDLVALLFWYAEKAKNSPNTEGVVLLTNNDLFTEFETIN